MKTALILLIGLTSFGCATESSREPYAMVGPGDAETCRAAAAAAVYPSTLATPTPTERSYPWTAGRNWAQNSAEERLRERDVFESCMATGNPRGR
jgi:hypothetical protein